MHSKQTTDKADKYKQSGVYKLTCPDCNKTYVGQTGRNFLARFNEHKAAFKTNSHTSNFAKHLIEDTLFRPHPQHNADTTTPRQRGTPQYYIYAEFTKNNHLNDEHTISSNKIFEALLKPDQPKNLPPSPL